MVTIDKTVKITFDKEYFDIKDTLCCGQIFRFREAIGDYGDGADKLGGAVCLPTAAAGRTNGGNGAEMLGSGYLVFSADKCAFCFTEGEKTVIECAAGDEEYFRVFFDLERDYAGIVAAAENAGVPALKIAARLGKGVRILNQNPEEALFSFIVSQNNNIPRIKGIIEKLCAGAGEERTFYGEEFGENGLKYRAFPSAATLAEMPESFFTGIGLGYRAGYIKGLAEKIAAGYSVAALSRLKTEELRKELVSIKGVGPKVADCAVLFGFHRADGFPVDTWIEKVYKEDFGGTLTDRKKISEYFVDRFGENSGYFQQYLFYYKRSLEKETETKPQNGLRNKR